MEPKEVVGSVGLDAHIFIILGIHLKFCVRANQRCQFQLDCAFFLKKSLGDGMFLELFSATTGATTLSLETTFGIFPSTDLEALVGLDFLPDARFLWLDKREFATHFA